jgi:hypothetical protein
MRGYLISLWSILDPIYFFFTRLSYPYGPKQEGNIFRIRTTTYKGRSIVLSDGTRIFKNDTLIKIHLHNVRLLKELKDIKSEIKKTRIIYRYVQQSLPGVEAYIRIKWKYKQIKGIVGITNLHKGCERFGFETVEISHPLYKIFKQLAFLPIGILSSKNTPLRHFVKNKNPKYIFMSMDTLSRMYGQ